MKKLFILFSLTLMFSCGHLFNSEQYEITYAFVDKGNISELDKKATIDVIKKRLSKFSSNVEVNLNTKNEIVVKLNSGFDIENLNIVVENQGKLDFWPCISKDKMVALILDIDRVAANDSVSKPLSSLVQQIDYSGTPVFSVSDTIKIQEFLKDAKVQMLFIEEYKDLKFLYGLPKDGYLEFYALESNSTGRAPVNETHLVDVKQVYDQIDRPAIGIKMSEYGGHKWYKMTNYAYINQTRIAIALNDVVYSAPSVSSGPISGGLCEISGDFTVEQAKDLSNVLSSQQLILKLKFVNMIKLEKQ